MLVSVYHLPAMTTDKTYDVIIIGAGAAGVGLGVLFEKMGLENYLILEKDTVGSSFKQWSPYTRFISPSFSGNAFGAVDLNAITPDTSPAHTLKNEHPSGNEYAQYLKLVADHFGLKVVTGVEVGKVAHQDDFFTLETGAQTFHCRNLVWAGGEWQYPSLPKIPGAEYGVHSSKVIDATGDQVTIIGGYESGMDLAKEALAHGKDVTIIDAKTPWTDTSSDSSVSISLYTQEKIRPYIGSAQLTLIGNTPVTEITKEASGFLIHTDTGEPIHAPEPPIFATGFMHMSPVIAPYFSETDAGVVAITEDDESTIAPGCFLIGPKVQHGEAIFCFIYKFRQRLPIVAETIAERLGLEVDVPEEYYRTGMYLKDLSCCADECAC